MNRSEVPVAAAWKVPEAERLSHHRGRGFLSAAPMLYPAVGTLTPLVVAESPAWQ
jgi:hypothetical protein